jgi:DegV family protein with EDD domain
VKTVEKIAILTDSSSDLSDEIIAEYGINILPLLVVYKNKAYKDRIEIKPQQVYDLLETEIPKTSLPSIGDVKAIFDRFKKENYTHVLVITVSSGLSGTYGMLNMICKEYTDMKIKLIDSKSLSMGLGFTVYEAAKAVKNGKNFDETCSIAEKVRNKNQLFFVIKTLKYLKAGGRIGKVEASLGEIMNIKPIISIDEDGVYYSYAKILGWHKAVRKLLDIFEEKASNKRINVAVMNGGDAEEAEELLKKVKASGMNINEIFTGQISPSLVVHTGPGLLGLTFYEIDDNL